MKCNKILQLIIFFLVLAFCRETQASLSEDELRQWSQEKAELLLSEREKFISGSIKQGYTGEQANKIFEYIIKFANYGFNKSHGVAYALIAYQMAYLKTYFYKSFMCALMTNNIGRPLGSMIISLLELSKEVSNPTPIPCIKESIHHVTEVTKFLVEMAPQLKSAADPLLYI